MTETLWGVVIGGGIGVMTALVTSVLGAILTARHERALERSRRVHGALTAITEPQNAWLDAMSRTSQLEEVGLDELRTASREFLQSVAQLRTATTDPKVLQLIAVTAGRLDAATAAAAAAQKGDLSSADLNSMESRLRSTVEVLAHVHVAAALQVDQPALPMRIYYAVQLRRAFRQLQQADRAAGLTPVM